MEKRTIISVKISYTHVETTELTKHYHKTQRPKVNGIEITHTRPFISSRLLRDTGRLKVSSRPDFFQCDFLSRRKQSF